jgi:hypothetical protein
VIDEDASIDVLRSLQASLEELYDLAIDLDVSEFIVSDTVRSYIPGALEGIPEQLFIAQAEDEVELALYIAPEILRSLDTDAPEERLHAGNLEDYWIALEGVSHFTFLVWRTQRGRPVSHLELELQAEVDKFVRSWQLLVEQGRPVGLSGRALCRALFDSYEVRNDIPCDQVETYRMASVAAERFCRKLVERYTRPYELTTVRAEARDYYRQGLSEKMRVA